ncbi:Uncharacterised protein [Clostridioides difficile]|nr:Uncharacterised protein [Clostridioides difficile]
MKEAATDIAPATTPIADTLVPANLFTAATATKTTTINARMPATIQKIGHANIASFAIHCPAAYFIRYAYPAKVFVFKSI